MRSWQRARFHANPDDYRPVEWPPPGPFWCTGFTDVAAIVVAYVRELEQIDRFWPEAKWVEATDQESITFTDRFPCPDWWDKQQGQPR